MYLENVEVSGIKRVVINRVSVWERRECAPKNSIQFKWVKTAGGPGFDANKAMAMPRSPEEMKRAIDNLFQRWILENNEIVPLYRAWVHGDTLNIVLNK